MTIPHMMNCPHDERGWCLACVGDMHVKWTVKLAIAVEALKATDCRSMPMDCPHLDPTDIQKWCTRCAALCLLEIQT